MFFRKDPVYSNRLTRSFSLSDDLQLFFVLGILGALVSYLSVNIPNTDVYFDVRQVFAFMAFALLSRWWLALLAAMIIAASGFHEIPISTAFFGNLLFMGPILVVIRLVHTRYLSRMQNLLAYGIAWFLLTLFCYQAFLTPLIWGLRAFFMDASVFPMIL